MTKKIEFEARFDWSSTANLGMLSEIDGQHYAELVKATDKRYQVTLEPIEPELPRMEPCLRCGGSNVYVSYIHPFSLHGDQARVNCATCGTLGPPRGDLFGAIDAWNSRK